MNCIDPSVIPTESLLWLAVVILASIVAVMHYGESHPDQPKPPRYHDPDKYEPDMWRWM